MAKERAGARERLLQPQDPDEPVWRYLDLAKYIDLIGNRKLHLRRVDRFEDPFEATLPASCRRRGARTQGLHEARRRTYVNCWRLGHDESEAMWKLYCGNAGGIALVLPYRRLVESARRMRCEIGLVRYIDYTRERFPDAPDIVSASMYKRIAFAHEREVRLVKHRRIGTGRRRPTPESVYVSWDPELWVERIVVSPLSQGYFRSATLTVTRALAPALVKRFAPSQMQIEPAI